jgi:hypothetical protein
MFVSPSAARGMKCAAMSLTLGLTRRSSKCEMKSLDADIRNNAFFSLRNMKIYSQFLSAIYIYIKPSKTSLLISPVSVHPCSLCTARNCQLYGHRKLHSCFLPDR